MIRVLIATAIALSSMASAQQAAPVTPVPKTEGKIVITGKAKKVCETTASLGSIIPTRVCKTQEEWDEIHERSLILVGKMQDDQMFRANAERHAKDGK